MFHGLVNQKPLEGFEIFVADVANLERCRRVGRVIKRFHFRIIFCLYTRLVHQLRFDIVVVLQKYRRDEHVIFYQLELIASILVLVCQFNLQLLGA